MERKISVDVRYEAYGSFFVDDFARQAFDASKGITDLESPVFDLIADWRSASYAGALPSLIPSSVKRFHDAFVGDEPTPTGILRYSNVVMGMLSREVPELTNDIELQRRIRERIVRLAGDIADAVKSANRELDQEWVWQHFLNAHPFSLGLHGTMRLVFLAVYGAYENFLVRILSIAHSGVRIRVTDKDFNKRLRDAFGSLAEDAWFDARICSFRAVRNSLSHAGGRITPDVRASRIPVEVHDGALHVYPEHIKNLYDTLKVPSLQMIRSECFR